MFGRLTGYLLVLKFVYYMGKGNVWWIKRFGKYSSGRITKIYCIQWSTDTNSMMLVWWGLDKMPALGPNCPGYLGAVLQLLYTGAWIQRLVLRG